MKLVRRVHLVITAEGMGLSQEDVGRIVSLFLEGLVHSEPPMPHLDRLLQQMADECSAVTNE